MSAEKSRFEKNAFKVFIIHVFIWGSQTLKAYISKTELDIWKSFGTLILDYYSCKKMQKKKNWIFENPGVVSPLNTNLLNFNENPNNNLSLEGILY